MFASVTDEAAMNLSERLQLASAPVRTATLAWSEENVVAAATATTVLLTVID